ncbi:Uu.00g077200.m01.CDS01 [Anthostomella pinea]|uniref:Uu.00g077200.m01.CDS01 n=1 Tax=Anthostomella pinea TaxID=933095 RepID=A0AAI8YPC7_9PEZI|nr:Uu.00g077200.m01.CDS01 [Anthostomella pinea]
MVNVRNIAASLAFSSIIGAAVAHPGDPADEVKRELESHKSARPFARRALNSCAGSPETAALKARSVARRAAAAEALRQKRGLAGQVMRTKRDLVDLEQWATVDHDSSALGYSLDTPLETIFDSNATCALVPEVTIGPYWVAGELIRADVTDAEPGVPVHLDLQFVDINTCEPIPDMLIDIWHCNSTGVYSGVNATGQGGLDATYLRGIQGTDADGVAQFDTIFPGHYTGRAPHIHLMSTENATILSNNTYLSGKPNHIGQLFFDQDLITEVETLTPYTANTQRLTLNVDDGIDAQTATEDYDPFVAYVRLGDDLNSGVLAYLTVFVDTTANYTSSARAAAHYYEGGGVSTGNTGGGGPRP